MGHEVLRFRPGAIARRGTLWLALLGTGCAGASVPPTAAPRPPFVLGWGGGASTTPTGLSARSPAPTSGGTAGGSPEDPGAPSGPDGPGGTGGGTGSGSGGGAGGTRTVTAAPLVVPPPVLPAGPVSGTVRVGYPEGEGPAIAGALVRFVAAGGGEVRAVSDADGAFTLDLPGGAGDLVITAAGHAPSQLVGWDGADGGVYHLGTGDRPLPRPESRLPIAGLVTDEEGTPMPDAVVVGGDARGNAIGPFHTDADGRFAGLGRSVDGPLVEDLALWALIEGPGGVPTAVGLATDVTMGEGEPEAVIRLRPAPERVTLAPTGPAGARTAEVVAEAPNGAAVVLGAWGPGEAIAPCPLPALPAGRVVARVLVEADDARSSWQGVVTGPGALAPALLPFPDLPAAAVAEGAELRWNAVPGADGYRVALRQDGFASPVWEAWTAGTVFTARAAAGVAADAMSVEAVAGAAATPRALLAYDPGPRRLRWLEEAPGLRIAGRTRRVPPAP